MQLRGLRTVRFGRSPRPMQRALPRSPSRPVDNHRAGRSFRGHRPRRRRDLRRSPERHDRRGLACRADRPLPRAGRPASPAARRRPLGPGQRAQDQRRRRRRRLHRRDRDQARRAGAPSDAGAADLPAHRVPVDDLQLRGRRQERADLHQRERARSPGLRAGRLPGRAGILAGAASSRRPRPRARRVPAPARRRAQRHRVPVPARERHLSLGSGRAAPPAGFGRTARRGGRVLERHHRAQRSRAGAAEADRLRRAAPGRRRGRQRGADGRGRPALLPRARRAARRLACRSRPYPGPGRDADAAPDRHLALRSRRGCRAIPGRYGCHVAGRRIGPGRPRSRLRRAGMERRGPDAGRGPARAGGGRARHPGGIRLSGDGRARRRRGAGVLRPRRVPAGRLAAPGHEQHRRAARPRDRAQAGRGEPASGEGGGRGGEPRQEQLPRQHEPRVADPAQRDHRLHPAGDAAGEGCPAGQAVRESREDPGEFRAPALADQQYPRPRQGRGGAHGGEALGLRPGAGPRPVPPHRRAPRQERGRAPRPGRPGPAPDAAHGRGEAAADPDQPAQQRHQVHRGRIGHATRPLGR